MASVSVRIRRMHIKSSQLFLRDRPASAGEVVCRNVIVLYHSETPIDDISYSE